MHFDSSVSQWIGTTRALKAGTNTIKFARLSVWKLEAGTDAIPPSSASFTAIVGEESLNMVCVGMHSTLDTDGKAHLIITSDKAIKYLSTDFTVAGTTQIDIWPFKKGDGS